MSTVLLSLATLGCTSAVTTLPQVDGRDAAVDEGLVDARGLDANAVEPEDAGHAPMTLAEFCRRASRGLPESFARCWGGEASRWAYLGSGDENCPYEAALVASGGMRFDPVAAERCLIQMEAGPCDQAYWYSFGSWSTQATWRACTSVFTGLQPIGEPCTGRDCTDDAVCDNRRYVTDGTCSNVCIARRMLPLASSCTWGVYPSECETGLICDARSATDENGVCARRVTIGEWCAAEGVDCIRSVCDERGFCEPLQTVGSTCEAQGQLCEWGGSQCIGHQCVRLLRLGDLCSPDEPLGCAPFAYCGRAGTNLRTCRLGPFNGEPCDPDAPHEGCPFGWCDRGTCRALLAHGSECRSSDECLGWCVDGVCIDPDACPPAR
jgi:hypothetical protein